MRDGIAVALALLPALLLAPAALAHGDAWEASLWAEETPIHASLHGAPVPVAGAPMTLTVAFPGGRPEGEEVTARLTGPDGKERGLALEPQPGSLQGAAFFSDSGNWTLRIQVGSSSLEEDLRVYPAGDAFVHVHDVTAAGAVLFAGEPARIRLTVTNARDEPLPPASDALAIVETWDAAGARLRGTTEAPLEAEAPGVFAVEGTWEEEALVRVHVASATWGLQPGDRPPVSILVAPAEEAHVYAADEGGRDAPLAAFIVGLAVLAAAVGKRRG